MSHAPTPGQADPLRRAIDYGLAKLETAPDGVKSVISERGWRGKGREIRDGKMYCLTCQEHIALTEFYVHRSKESGKAHYASDCHACRKVRMICRNLGITREQYLELLAKAEGKCEICGRSGGRLSIDHCHDTGKIRGVLCQACNTALGSFQDSVELLKRAALYLVAHSLAEPTTKDADRLRRHPAKRKNEFVK
jgi:hypothetical protein